MAYNPNNGTLTNKSLGVAQGVATDLRSRYFDVTSQSQRDYQSTAEVISELPISKRQGAFPIFINTGTLTGNGSDTPFVFTGGTRNAYWFRDGVADANLVIQSSGTTITDYVTLSTAQTVVGTKNFSADITVNTIKIGLGNGNIASNTMVGLNSMQNNTSGSRNVAIGYYALYANTTGQLSVAIGSTALANNTTGEYNVAIGSGSMSDNIAGSQNTSIGIDSLRSNTTGNQNTGIGDNTLVNNTTGNDNTAIGMNALSGVTAGSNNIGIGNNAGLGIGAGNYNTIIGGNIPALPAGLSNNIILADGLGNRRINVSAVGNVGIGTNSADASAILEVKSMVKGVLVPRMTTAQRDAISLPAVSLLIYNTITNQFEFYTGTAWAALAVGGGATPNLQQVTNVGNITTNNVELRNGLGNPIIQLQNSNNGGLIQLNDSIGATGISLDGTTGQGRFTYLASTEDKMVIAHSDGSLDTQAIPSGNGPLIQFTLTNVDGSYDIPTRSLVTHFVIESTSNINFKIGDSESGNEIADAPGITAGTPYPISAPVVAANFVRTIYFSGIAGTGAAVTITIIKNSI